MPGSTGGIANVVAQLHAERVRFLLLRLSFAGLCLLYLLLLLWAMPWLPFGMGAGGYGGATVVLLLLLAACFFASLAFLVFWGPHFQHESLPEFLRVLFGAQQLIRGPAQFHSRLDVECRRGQRRGRHVFSLIVIRLAECDTIQRGNRGDMHRLITMLVRSLVRTEDIVAESGPREVWVLALGAGPEPCRLIEERLASALGKMQTPLALTGACSIGAATFGRDGEERLALFSTARQRLTPVTEIVGAPTAA